MPDGVFFVDLAFIDGQAIVLMTIAFQLGVVKTGGQPLVETIKAHLKLRPLLLLLDNFEQVQVVGLQGFSCG